MKAKRGGKALATAAVALAVLVGGSWTASAQSGNSAAGDRTRDRLQQSPGVASDQDRIRDHIRDRIRGAAGLTAEERAAMQENLEACDRAGAVGDGLRVVFPGDSDGRQISAKTMLRLQGRIRAAAQEGLPLDAVLAKLQEARTKGVPEANLERVCERMENHVREARTIMERARADGMTPAGDARHERRMIQDVAQDLWRGTPPEDVDQLRIRAHERSRERVCTLEDLAVASETATRLREEGVEARRAMRLAGDALAAGYGAEELRRLQYMMVYRHREQRGVSGLVDDFEHCLGAGMNATHMYQYMMQRGWMGPGDMHGPGGSSPMDDQGHGPGKPGGGMGGPMQDDHHGGTGGGMGEGGTGSGGPGG